MADWSSDSNRDPTFSGEELRSADLGTMTFGSADSARAVTQLSNYWIKGRQGQCGLVVDEGGLVTKLRDMRSCALTLAVAFPLAGCGAVTVEEPSFKVILKDGQFQVRDYPALTTAEVTVTGGQWSAANKGFRLLAGYIFGGNSPRQRIPMTAPVAQERTGEKIPMAAPVTQTQAPEGWVVRFIMPAGSTPATLPAPIDNRVRLSVSPPTRQAVVRFSGWALSGAVEAKTRQLQVWMASRHLAPTGPATLAQYDPPWTLWFIRRNEIMIRLSE